MGFSGGGGSASPNYEVSPVATPNYGIVNIGDGGFSGGGAGHAAGSAAGTGLFINLAAGSTADLVRMQVAGVDALRIDAPNLETTCWSIATKEYLTDVTKTKPYLDYTQSGNVLVVMPRNDAQVPLFTQAHSATQTADLFASRSSAGTVLAGITANGEVYGHGLAVTPTTYAALHTLTTADSISEDTGTYTVTLPAASGALAGRRYTVANVSTGVITLAVNTGDSLNGTTNGTATVAAHTAYSMVRNAAGTGWLGATGV